MLSGRDCLSDQGNGGRADAYADGKEGKSNGQTKRGSNGSHVSR